MVRAPYTSSRQAALIELARLDKSDLSSALRRIVAVDATTLDVERVSYWELAPDHTQITCRTLHRRTPHSFESGATLGAHDFPAYFEAMLSCRTIVAHDAWTHPHTAEFTDVYFRPNGITSMLDVPVWRRGQLVGVVCHEHVGMPRVWAPEEQEFALGVANMISVALEATGRRHAEEGYAMVTHAIQDVLWDWNIDTGELQFSDSITSRFAYNEQSVTPTIGWWLERIHPLDRIRVRDALHRLLASTETHYAEQYRFVCGDGRVATVIDRGFIARDEHACPRRMVGSMVDISERMAMQERLAQSERMASIGSLAAGVAHEVNNPLTYIMSNLECAIASVRDPDLDRDALAEMLAEALEGAHRVRGVVRDLKDLSRPAACDVERVDVREVIEASIKLARNELRHRAQLVRELHDVPPVAIDARRFGQVILNLLINAAQAIPEGDVDQHRIRVSTRTENDRVIIEVADTGPGVPPELRSRIFEPFFTTKQVGSGTGLGLSICRSIISGAGGDLGTYIAPEGGCLMRITLPVPITRTPIEPLPTEVPEVTPRKILLVDDDARVRKALCRMLEPKHEVVVVDSGHAALEHILGGETFDVILCDLLMPRMTGMELYDRLREIFPVAADRMVFMTGGASSERATRFVQSTSHIVLDKPVEAAALARALHSIAPRS